MTWSIEEEDGQYRALIDGDVISQHITWDDARAAIDAHRQIATPVGKWWAAYDDGCVWPVEVIELRGPWLGTIIRPVHPAPDAGERRAVHPSRVYDSAGNAPTVVAA